MAVEVRNDPEHERYVALVDGEVAGHVAYKARPGLMALMHTQVDPRFEGHGVGSSLARTALDEAREHGDAVLPFCPFVTGWIARHEAYLDLVPAERRRVFGL